jgi:DNA polymerase-3 subunit gamma/tau
MLPTVLSRCLQFNLRPMAPETVHAHLAQVLGAEGVACDEGALRLLSRAARGSMRDGLSLTDQAIAYGGGRIDEAGVRAMLGTVDRGHAKRLVEALARRDGRAVLEVVDALRALGLSAAGTLEEMAALLQQMAVEQAVPGALAAADPKDPENEDACRLAAALAPDETQLLYSIVLHGRAELSLMSDEYGALTMVLLRLLAFPSSGGAVPAPPARAAPLRAPAPPAMTLAVPKAVAPVVAEPAPPRAAAPKPVPAQPPAPAPALANPDLPPATPPAASSTPPAPAAPDAPADKALADRWQALVRRLAEQGAISAMVRELAWQAGLAAVDESALPPRWRLVVERESLRSTPLADKLAAALAAELGAPQAVEVEAGQPTDTPARRDAAERARAQSAAEETIRADPLVQSLLGQFKTARIVPGSIKPV